jgi:hypothetical protein
MDSLVLFSEEADYLIIYSETSRIPKLDYNRLYQEFEFKNSTQIFHGKQKNLPKEFPEDLAGELKSFSRYYNGDYLARVHDNRNEERFCLILKKVKRNTKDKSSRYHGSKPL